MYNNYFVQKNQRIYNNKTSILFKGLPDVGTIFPAGQKSDWVFGMF
jgi:hypothetical protein